MIEIREATVEDIPAIAQVHVNVDWDTYFLLFGAAAYRLTLAESEERWRRTVDGEGLLLVACDRGAIVGFGHTCADRIDALYLMSVYHRRGIRKAIVSRLLRFLHRRGILEATLDVVAINAAAIAFYEAQGAHPIGRHVNSDPRGDTENLIFAVPTAQGEGQPVP